MDGWLVGDGAFDGGVTLRMFDCCNGRDGLHMEHMFLLLYIFCLMQACISPPAHKHSLPHHTHAHHTNTRFDLYIL